MRGILVIDTTVGPFIATRLAEENPNTPIYYAQPAAYRAEPDNEVHDTLLGFDKFYDNLKKIGADYLEYIPKVDLIVFTDVGMGSTADLLRRKGFNVINGSKAVEELEFNRSFAKRLYAHLGRDFLIPPSITVESPDKAIDVVKKQFIKRNRGVVIKFNTNLRNDKFQTTLFKQPELAIPYLESISHYSDVEVVLEEYIEGQEIAIGGYFNGKDFLSYLCYNIEDPTLMKGTQIMTGEMGTLVWYFDRDTFFYDLVLKPLIPYLRRANYVGYIDANCIYDYNNKQLYFIEFTCRFGYPLVAIQDWLHNMTLTELLTRVLKGGSFSASDFITYDINKADTPEEAGYYALGICINGEGYPYSNLVELASNKPIYGLKIEDLKERKPVDPVKDPYRVALFNLWYDSNDRLFKTVWDAYRALIITKVTNEDDLEDVRESIINWYHKRYFLMNAFIKCASEIDTLMTTLKGRIGDLFRSSSDVARKSLARYIA